MKIRDLAKNRSASQKIEALASHRENAEEDAYQFVLPSDILGAVRFFETKSMILSRSRRKHPKRFKTTNRRLRCPKASNYWPLSVLSALLAPARKKMKLSFLTKNLFRKSLRSQVSTNKFFSGPTFASVPITTPNFAPIFSMSGACPC